MKRQSQIFVTVTAALSMLGMLLGFIGTEAASAGTLTSVTWTVNNSQSGATGITYAFAMKTATAGTIKTVTLAVPAGTAGSIAVGTVYGLGAGTVALASNTITYTVTTAVSVAAGIPIYLSFTALKNTTTSGSYTSVETTQTGLPATIDTGTSPSITFGASATTASVTVGQTLTFTNNTPSFSLNLDPVNSTQTQTVVLTVQTNAALGYTVAASDLGLSRSTPNFTIPAVSTGPTVGVATFPSSGFGVSATLTAAGGSAAALVTGLATVGNFVGYPTTTATLVSATHATGASADTLTLNNQVQVDYAVPDGTYTDTITYVVTPNY